MGAGVSAKSSTMKWKRRCSVHTCECVCVCMKCQLLPLVFHIFIPMFNVEKRWMFKKYMHFSWGPECMCVCVRVRARALVWVLLVLKWCDGDGQPAIHSHIMHYTNKRFLVAALYERTHTHTHSHLYFTITYFLQPLFDEPPRRREAAIDQTKHIHNINAS